VSDIEQLSPAPPTPTGGPEPKWENLSMLVRYSRSVVLSITVGGPVQSLDWTR